MRIAIYSLIVLVLAFAGGAAAYFLKPKPDSTVVNIAPEPEPLAEPEYVNMTREFVVPLVSDTRVHGHVVLTLGLHSETIPRDQLLRLEPVFRDRLLETLLRHASAGGFDSQFTSAINLNRLRTILNETASTVVNPEKASVLITSIDRREL